MDVFWANFPGCECLKRILLDCGFDNEFSISIINNDAINLIEAHLNENREIVQNLGGCHKQFYEKQTRIALLPAHTLTLSKLPEFIKSKSNELKNNHPAFSSVLSAMVNTASKNYQKHPNAHRYPKLLHDFAMYTYLTSGKASYKMICRNLPLPRESTISKLLKNLGCNAFSFCIFINLLTNELNNFVKIQSFTHFLRMVIDFQVHRTAIDVRIKALRKTLNAI